MRCARRARSLLAPLLVGVVAVGVVGAGCGSSSPAGSGHSLPTGADEVVVRVEYVGGFAPPEVLLRRLPQLLVTGDGRVFTPGAVAEVYPGPLVLPVMVGTIDREGLATILAAADSAQLLGPPPDYALPPGVGIMDAADTVVTVTADGVTYTHRAYALGLDETSTTARARLAGFVDKVLDLATLVGPTHLGDAEVYAPAAYRVMATVVDPAQYTEPEPTVLPWPGSTGLHPGGMEQCTVVDADAVGSLFLDANELTFFDDGGVVYRLAVVEQLPGEHGCAAE